MLRLLRHRCNQARSPIFSAKWQVKPPTSGFVPEKTKEELQAELSVSDMKETGVGDLIMVTCQICHATRTDMKRGNGPISQRTLNKDITS